ncbi:lysine-specific histone demethylase 1 [Nannochloropsis gaditana]|uniref:Amine oxidase n=1 Tax=Nannochloropsis gaditana TaxID=72520 RepID=W7T8U3_9STRA|nr:lysine-specific histone demethylase 1 [Nannochloropsis gaditana]
MVQAKDGVIREGESHEVIVVGAGVAGMAAAHTLRQTYNIHDVVILEARGRTGGRVHTNKQGIDEGASWVYSPEKHALVQAVGKGIGDARLVQMADPTDTVNCTVENARMRVWDAATGEEVPREEVRAGEEKFNEILGRVGKEVQPGEGGEGGESLEAALLRTTEGQDATALFRWQRARFEGWVGGTLGAVSSREADSFYGHEGGHEGRDWCLQGGYGPMLRCLEAGAGDIRLNVAVKEVVLEVFLEFPHPPVPPPDADILGFLPPASSSSSTPSLSSTSLPHPALYLDLGRLLPPSSPPSLPPSYRLLALFAGEDAEHLEALSEDAGKEAALRPLRAVFGDAERGGGKVGLPPPSRSWRTRWGADEWAKGSYSYLKPGGRMKDRLEYAKPLYDCLFFAGEATNAEHPACVDGAYVSGVRAAREVKLATEKG